MIQIHMIHIRQAKHVHYSVLVFWFGVGGLVVSIIGIFAIDTQPMFQNWDMREWILSFMVALVGILGSILMTKAVCWVTPSKVMVVRSFEVVAAYILQVTVFDVPTHWSDLAGTMCVIAAVIGMGVEDCLMETINWRFL
jgi:drug/metabolite transporter (DMT)-like permease